MSAGAASSAAAASVRRARVPHHADGLDVFPRLADDRDNATCTETVSDRVSTGIAALDDALEDGYWPGAVTLIAGPDRRRQDAHGPALPVPRRRTRRARRLRHLSGEPNPARAHRRVASAGTSTTPTSRSWTVHRSTSTSTNSSTSCSTGSSETGARRVVIDSLGDLIVASPDPMRLREFMYSLVQRCARRESA